MLGFTVRRTSEVRRHIADCGNALMAAERALMMVKGAGTGPALPGALRRLKGAMEVLHRKMAQAGAAAGGDVTAFTGGLPKPEQPDED